MLYKTAVIFHLFLSIFAVVTAFSALMNGPSEQGVAQGVPQVVIVLSTLLGVAGLVSTYGAWQRQKWGIWLTVVVQALNGLLALPGVLFAPSFFAWVAATSGVLLSVFIIFVLLRR